MRLSSFHATGLLALAGTAAAKSTVGSMSSNTRQMFTECMDWMDTFYDSEAGYLYDFSAAAATRHETRSSAWYAFGLLARNQDNDVAEAKKIIKNIISGQYLVPSEEWYGDYQKEPEEPYVGSAAYPASIYNSWDPNWRGFVGTTFVLALEEFGDLLDKKTQKLMLDSLHKAVVGDSYRFGHLDPKLDNLYPAYSNPSIMRAFVSGWVGRRLKESNMTKAGETYAQEIIDLFDEQNTLSEFNSGTYTGVSLFGLILWSKYLPKDSVMSKKGPVMIEYTWESIAALWHPGLKNMAGPWDRSYGYDMNRYLSLMALWFWPLIGKEKSGLVSEPEIMSHAADFAWAPLFAVLADKHQSLIPKKIVKGLSKFQGEHTFSTSTRSPPFDNAPRNFTTWLSDKITIGAESFDEIVVGGPARSPQSFNPAVIQWDTGSEISFISLFPTEMALDVEVNPMNLTLSYPYGTASSIFTLVVGTFANKKTVSGWEDVQGLDVTVSGNVNEKYALSFGGSYGGANSPIRDFEFWNFTYTMPAGFEGVPTITLDLELLS
ncbi:hypothetical protein EDB81DRAFT_688108 [Dactylonectria macrodidyma]|uniref:Uncharacterized protein n=1 Tax=Dactylonectria macrodidyma TaxID=307937 RepID=A0A9P9J4X4_9HYPO|nr:hypothetical protein EDB81DRAFT_688108 [Dactylonectria macrodidyma]